MRTRALVVLFSLFAFGATAMAKPSDWADVIEKPGEKSALPSARENAAPVVTSAKATSAKPAKKERALKKTKKSKKAPRRGKAKHGRR